MARLPRLAVDGQLHLVLQVGHNRQPVFVDDVDRQGYLDALRDVARAEQVAVHAYALLDAEVWLLVTPASAAGLSRWMQGVGRRYVAAFNRRHGRSGTVWAGRYRATVVDPQEHLLDCMVHVESLPQRTGTVAAAAEWQWSSALHHVGLRRDVLVTEHPGFWALGNTPFDREARYRDMLERGLTATAALRIDDATRKGWVLGSRIFTKQLESTTRRRLVPSQRGRPPGRRSQDDVSPINGPGARRAR